MNNKIFRYGFIITVLFCALILAAYIGLYVWFRLDNESFAKVFKEPLSEWHAKRFYKKMREANPKWNRDPYTCPILSITERQKTDFIHGFFNFHTIYSPDNISIYTKEVSNLEPLSEYQLSRLTLINTTVSDISPLRNSPLVTFRAINAPMLKDISALGNAPLYNLELSDTKITNLSPLSRKKELKSLFLQRTPVDDLSPLKGCDLNELTLIKTPVKDMLPLSGCAFSSLYIIGSGITDLSPLYGRHHHKIAVDMAAITPPGVLAKLDVNILRVRCNPGDNLQILEGKKLTYIYLDFNFQKIKRLPDIGKLDNIVVSIIGSDIEDLSSLRGKTIRHIDRAGSKLSRVNDRQLEKKFGIKKITRDW